ncbi:putative RNA-directed DNA polymerase [Aphis craccivora]|uniref:Putative RNA-directed DNA polymerase n=1 Tax=Aphis craccivora TaxID=307492 RepID=A0A6G0YRA1_APHCR|nr:putative RNA-directed DNA polymerase [Aphis craccivora]
MQSQLKYTAIFADDAKLFRFIRTPLDTKLLQYDLDNITCVHMSLLNKYFLNGIELERVNQVKDVSVYFNSMTPLFHSMITMSIFRIERP